MKLGFPAVGMLLGRLSRREICPPSLHSCSLYLIQSGVTLDCILFAAASRYVHGRKRSAVSNEWGSSRRRVGLRLAQMPLDLADPDCAQAPPTKLRLAFGVPGDLATPTGGYGYDRRIIRELRHLGWRVDVVDVGRGFPFPSAAQRAKALVALSAVPAGCPTVLDGLAFGALPEASALRSRSPLIALVHQPLALDPVSIPRWQTLFARASAPRSLLRRASWSRVRQRRGSGSLTTTFRLSASALCDRVVTPFRQRLAATTALFAFSQSVRWRRSKDTICWLPRLPSLATCPGG